MSKEQFEIEQENFYSRLKEDEEYATVSMKMYMLDRIVVDGKREKDYTIHSIKQNNPKHKEDENLKELYKAKKRLNKDITELEQKLNHGLNKD
jgi:hypothetical protein